MYYSDFNPHPNPTCRIIFCMYLKFTLGKLFYFFRELQLNLITSHAAGVGDPLSPDKTRMLLALRINILAKGYSGIRIKTLKQYIDAFNGKKFMCWVTQCFGASLPHFLISRKKFLKIYNFS